MRVNELSLGWQTEFILHRLDARIDERDDCITVRTDANPNFYWGNCLVLPAAPADDALAFWLARFHALVAAGRPEVRHVAVGIDAARQGCELPAWCAAGFDIDEVVALALRPGGLLPLRQKAQQPQTPQAPQSPQTPQTPQQPQQPPWQLRLIEDERNREALIELQCQDSVPYEPAGYRRFQQRQQQRHARLAQQGRGAWFGLWCGDTLAAQCGLMRDHAGPGALGRFQQVSTHPDWRRRGLCTALVHGVSQWGFQHWQLAQAVLCADPRDVAIHIYQSLGYQPIGEFWQLQRNAPQDQAALAAAPASPT